MLTFWANILADGIYRCYFFFVVFFLADAEYRSELELHDRV